jgi:hypothetical protein
VADIRINDGQDYHITRMHNVVSSPWTILGVTFIKRKATAEHLLHLLLIYLFITTIGTLICEHEYGSFAFGEANLGDLVEDFVLKAVSEYKGFTEKGGRISINQSRICGERVGRERTMDFERWSSSNRFGLERGSFKLLCFQDRLEKRSIRLIASREGVRIDRDQS